MLMRVYFCLLNVVFSKLPQMLLPSKQYDELLTTAVVVFASRFFQEPSK